MDRHGERELFDRLVEAVRAGESRALVVRGEPGVGKTVLLDYLADQAHGCRVARAAGVQSEMELAFAGLHQLCAPVMDHLDRLPAPQRDALRTAFGLSTGSPPNRFLVGLAVLGLLSEVAAERPLICIVDDEQWLDHASAQALGFVARRLGADRVGLVLAARTPGYELAGLPELEVEGLREDHARELLDSALAVPLDATVRDLIIAETRGNPLALIELPRTLTPTELAGGFGWPRAAPLSGRIEHSFRRQLDDLPDQARRLLVLAAADPSGDPVLVRRAAGLLGIPVHAATPAVEAGLVAFGAHVRFRHPLVRSTAYRSASTQERHEVHGALAGATDPDTDPDRRAWHRAQAASGPDEDVAVELEHSAGRAQARGGLAAAAAFLEHAVRLTADPSRHAERVLAAATLTMQAGAFGRALELLATAEAGPLDELVGARVDLLRGQIAFAAGFGSDAPPLLLKAARRLERLDLELARETYLSAWVAASFAGRRAGAGDMDEISHAAAALPAARPPRPVDLLLDGLARLGTAGRAAAAPVLRRATARFAAGNVSREEGLRWGWLAASLLWDDGAAHAIATRQVRLARAAGALEQLPTGLVALAQSAAWSGEFTTAAALIAETDAICQVTGSRIVPYPAMFLAALRGDRTECTALVEEARAEGESAGQGAALTYAHWVSAVLDNGSGRYADAAAAARRAVDDAHPYVSMWALPELVEAAVRTGDARTAGGAVETLAETTRAGGTELGWGLEARSRALTSEGGAAEGCYREAIDRLGRTRLRPELARAHLLLGEWLRRENRRVDARGQLRIAHEMLETIGMEAFAERARRELVATGETARRRTGDNPGTLTPQEASIARLAGDGRTNAEIGTQLFLSARTVEWHLRKVYTKLAVSSRRELRRALSDPR
jgi:DNA-binding CsgD family transcriptional regulator